MSDAGKRLIISMHREPRKETGPQEVNKVMLKGERCKSNMEEEVTTSEKDNVNNNMSTLLINATKTGSNDHVDIRKLLSEHRKKSEVNEPTFKGKLDVKKVEVVFSVSRAYNNDPEALVDRGGKRRNRGEQSTCY